MLFLVFHSKAIIWFCCSGVYNPICIYCSAQWSEFTWKSCIISYKVKTHLNSFSFYQMTVSFNVKIILIFLNESEFLMPILKRFLLNLSWSMMNKKSDVCVKLTYRSIRMLIILILLYHFSIIQKHIFSLELSSHLGLFLKFWIQIKLF